MEKRFTLNNLVKVINHGVYSQLGVVGIIKKFLMYRGEECAWIEFSNISSDFFLVKKLRHTRN